MNKLVTSCLLAALAVGLGAFGAHALKELLAQNDTTDTWKTAAHYHLAHAIALFVLAAAGERLRCKWAFPLLTVGIVLFSGSLYLLSTVQWGILGPITPFGGIAFIFGWIALIYENRKGPAA